MFRRRAYPDRMDRDRLIALVCDIALEQGGDWDATGRVLRERLDDDDYEQAEWLAAWVLGTYREPWHYPGDPGRKLSGAELVRQMRDRRRRLVPALPAGAPGRGLWRRWSA